MRLYCNRFNWQHAVVMSANSVETLQEWARERQYAINNGQDYNTVMAVLPWKEK
jgi:hypothetical protein